MKKIVMTIVVLAMVMTSVMSVSASGNQASNMDSGTYAATRTAQVEEAYNNGTITAEQKELMLDHITDVVAEEAFGNGSLSGSKGDGNVVCVLGEDSELGIFRSESGGQRTGEGNGVGEKIQDGTGTGTGNGQGLQVGDGSSNNSEGPKGNRSGEGNGVGRNN